MKETQLTLEDSIFDGDRVEFDAYMCLKQFGISIVQSDAKTVFLAITRDDARRLQNFLTEFLIATR